MEGVIELTIDASAQLLMDDLTDILKNTKITKSNRRSKETMLNQKINYEKLEKLEKENVLKPSEIFGRCIDKPCTMIVGTRFNYYKKQYVQTAHDRDYGTGLYNKLQELTLHLGKTNNVDISMNTATINKNFMCSKHKDRNNKSKSVLCGLGDYTKGETIIYDSSDNPHTYNINNKPILFDGKDYYHEVLDFSGNRYSFVSYVI